MHTTDVNLGPNAHARKAIAKPRVRCARSQTHYVTVEG